LVGDDPDAVRIDDEGNVSSPHLFDDESCSLEGSRIVTEARANNHGVDPRIFLVDIGRDKLDNFLQKTKRGERECVRERERERNGKAARVRKDARY
jgi:hypothetical protein